MYNFKNELINDHPAVQEKARYFADYFEFSLSKFGRPGFATLENHRSLLEKIRFRLIHYQAKFDKKYLERYANHAYLSDSDAMVQAHFKEIKGVVKKVNNGAYADPVQRQSVINSLDSIIVKLNRDLFKLALDNIIRVLHCLEDLMEHDHLKVIEYATDILIAEFLLKGFQVKDLEKLFSRILTKKISFSTNGAITDFPLPKKLKDLKLSAPTSDAYFDAVSSFMEGRTLREQFEGIFNLYAEDKSTAFVFYKITNVRSKKRLEKKIDSVTLTTHYKPFLGKQKVNEDYREFFDNEDQLYLIVQLVANSFDSAEMVAIDTVNQVLPTLEMIFNTRIVVDFSTFIMRINERLAMKLALTSKWLISDYIKLSRRNQRPENAQTSLQLKKLERIYALAETTALADQKLNHYWRYLEAALQLPGSIFLETAARIIANYRTPFILFSYDEIAGDTLAANRLGGIKTPDGELNYRQIMDLISDAKLDAAWLRRASAVLNHPFLNQRLAALLPKTIETVNKELYNYYYAILLEAYEQRNFIQHDGIYLQISVDKILLTLPQLVEDLRHVLFSKARRNKGKSLEQIVAGLDKPAKKLLRLFKTGATVEII